MSTDGNAIVWCDILKTQKVVYQHLSLTVLKVFTETAKTLITSWLTLTEMTHLSAGCCSWSAERWHLIFFESRHPTDTCQGWWWMAVFTFSFSLLLLLLSMFFYLTHPVECTANTTRLQQGYCVHVCAYYLLWKQACSIVRGSTVFVFSQVHPEPDGDPGVSG